MKKRAFLALLLAAALLLTGCSSLVMRDSEVDGKQTIMSVNGDIVTKTDFLNLYNYNLYTEQYYAQMMAQFGYSDGSVDTASVMQNTAQTLIANMIIQQQAKALGLDQFTEEEEAQLAEEAQQELEQRQASATDSSAVNYTLESVLSSLRSNRISERVRAYVTDPVTVNDEDLQAALDEKIAAQLQNFAEGVNAYQNAVSIGNTIYAVPEGYRLIHAYQLNKPAAEEGQEIDEAAYAAQKEDLLARVTADASLEGLEVTETDYRIREGSTVPTEAAAAAAMALAQPGDITDLIETDTAAYVIRYVEDVAPYTATLDEVRDSLYDEVLSDAQTDAFTSQMTQWINDADIQLFLDRLN